MLFLTEIKALVHALTTKGNQCCRITILVVYVITALLWFDPLSILLNIFVALLFENFVCIIHTQSLFGVHSNPVLNPYLGCNKTKPPENCLEQNKSFIKHRKKFIVYCKPNVPKCFA